ncbi:MAG: hypothetical protein IT328_04485 [Caldilineaceae bacterium]|nr:hypothetical protein [Caldilineaceae bacterium]
MLRDAPVRAVGLTELTEWLHLTILSLEQGKAQIVLNLDGNTVSTEVKFTEEGRDQQGQRVRVERRTFNQLRIERPRA